ncbi:MAG: class II aldolase/adducin family protein [Gammaproteobacteria bacterium]
MDLSAQRQALVRGALALHQSGLSHSSSGNVSVRTKGGFVITPTGIGFEALALEQLVELTEEGAPKPGQLRPSSEWRFHRDLYRAQADVNAIVHVHSPYATALACARRAIPSFHYMVAMAGGDSIPCTPYATFGTQALSDAIIDTLNGRRACLLANHGSVATGEDLHKALDLAQEVEFLAKVYVLTERIGGSELLTDQEMRVVLEKFTSYGQQKQSVA